MSEQIPVIFRGEDTDFHDDSHLSITPDASFGLDGFRLQVTLQGLRKTCGNLTAGAPIEFSYSAEQTSRFTPGTCKMEVRLLDAKGRVRLLPSKLVVIADFSETAERSETAEIAFERLVSGSLTETDILDCGVTFSDLKRRIADMWEKFGGRVTNKEALEY